MKLIIQTLLLLGLLWRSEAALAQSLACIAGSSSNLSLVKAFKETDNTDNYPISLFRAWKKRIKADALKKGGLATSYGMICDNIIPSPLKRILDAIQPQPLTPVNPYPKEPAVDQIDSECVASVIQQTNFTPVDGVDHYLCKNQWSSQPSPQKETPCVTEEMPEYVTWLTNEALKCLSDEELPLDAATIFKMMNNESRFSFLVHYSGGTGITQLVRGGAYGEMERDLGGERFLKDRLKSGRKSCEPFAPLMDKTKKTFPCSVLQPGAGVARAILYGVGYFAYLKYPPQGTRVPNKVLRMRAVSRIGQFAVYRDPDMESRNELINDVVLVAYSNAGPAVAYSKLTESLQNLGCARSNPKCTARALRTDYRIRIARYYRTVPMGASKPVAKGEVNPAPRPNYLKEIDKRAATLDRDVESCIMDAGTYKKQTALRQLVGKPQAGGQK